MQHTTHCKTHSGASHVASATHTATHALQHTTHCNTHSGASHVASATHSATHTLQHTTHCNTHSGASHVVSASYTLFWGEPSPAKCAPSAHWLEGYIYIYIYAYVHIFICFGLALFGLALFFAGRSFVSQRERAKYIHILGSNHVSSFHRVEFPIHKKDRVVTHGQVTFAYGIHEFSKISH